MGTMPGRSVEVGEAERAEEANRHHMCTRARTHSTFNIPLKQKRSGFRSNKDGIGASASETYWGEKGICLLRILMNWGIIIQCSATIKDIQIQFRKYCKEYGGLMRIPQRRAVGGMGRRQRERATGMFWVNIPWSKAPLEPSYMPVFRGLRQGEAGYICPQFYSASLLCPVLIWGFRKWVGGCEKSKSLVVVDSVTFGSCVCISYSVQRNS